LKILEVNIEPTQLAAAIGLRGEYDTSGVGNLLLQKLARYTERDEYEYEYDMIYSNWSICICVYRREVDAFISNGWYVLRLALECALWKS